MEIGGYQRGLRKGELKQAVEKATQSEEEDVRDCVTVRCLELSSTGITALTISRPSTNKEEDLYHYGFDY
jgi:hypothetical protein